MPNQEYDYALMENGTTYKSYTSRKSFRLWRALFVLLLIIDVIGILVYFFKGGKTYPNNLEPYQPLNDVAAAITLPLPPSTVSNSSTPLNANEHAVVSSLYTDSYIEAIMTLGYSLKAANVNARMILIYLPDRLSPRTKCLATAAGWTLYPVSWISPPPGSKKLWSHYKDQYTKLNIWNLDTLGIKSLVYLDADTIVRRNIDELFQLPFNFGAVPDVFLGKGGYTLGFNAGVLFLRPNTTVFEDMMEKLSVARYPIDWAEQAFLNVYFAAQVVRLPYVYNSNLAVKVRSPEMWEWMKSDMRIVHFTLQKPFPSNEKTPDMPVERFLELQKEVDGGMWREELGWWEDKWRESTKVLQGSASHCGGL